MSEATGMTEATKSALIVTAVVMLGAVVSVGGVVARVESTRVTGDESRDIASKAAADAYENAQESLPKLFKILGQHAIAPIVARCIESFL